MAPSFDYYAESSLLCAEENTSILDDNDDDFVNYGDDFENCSNWLHRNQRNFNQNQNFISEDGFSGFLQMQMKNEECLASMFEKESQHLPGVDYLERLKSGDLNLESRKEAIDWIEKVQSHYNFGPLCVYLSINYMDRFLSTYQLPKGKAWMMQLLAVACLSLAAKMEETEVPLSLDFQVGEAKFVFEAKTIQRMELLVLSTLKWRMQSITPFSFIDYFLYKLNGGQMPPTTFFLQSIEVILSTIIKGIDFLEFRPSEIAAGVAIYVTKETQIVENPDKAISFLGDHVQKERVMKCVELIHDLTLNTSCKGSSGSSLTSVPQSPIGVLDAACLSYKSGDNTSTLSGSRSGLGSGSCSTSTHNSPPCKRRKLDKTIDLRL